ncbi:MAG: NAD(P)-dependent oxidoreductase [Candidatus Bathyarchaeia archaeon]
MKVAVTGGSGRLGSIVVKKLLNKGYEVINIDKIHPKLSGIEHLTEGFLRITADITDLGSVYDILKGCDAVIHLAAIIDPRYAAHGEVFRTNVISTFNVIQASWQLGIKKVVIASSATVIGTQFAFKDFPPQYFPIDEEHPVLPQDPYALSKLIGEEIAKSFVRRGGINIIALRFAWIMTPETYEQSLRPILKDPGLNKTNFWTYVDVRDAADACILAMESKTDGFEAFYVCARDTFMNIPTMELLRKYYPEVPVKKELKDYESPISIEKARRIIGYEPQYSARNYLKY